MNQKIIIELNNDFKNQNIINKSNLSKILSDNADTDYGRKYNFNSILDSNSYIEEYRQRVPLSEYDDYKETGINSVYKTYLNVHTSGTTGHPKILPVTHEALTRQLSYIYEEPFYLASVDKKNLLHLGLFNKTGNNTILTDAAFRYMEDNHILNCDSFIGGETCMFSDEKVNVLYLKAYIALANEDLTAILSTFLYDVLLFMNYIEKNYTQILFDMENKTFSQKLPPIMQKALLAMDVSEERISYLKKEFDNGFDCIMERLWKKLKLVVGASCGLFKSYENALTRYLGKIQIHNFGYAMSECIIGVSTKMNDTSYTILPRSAFYEFLSLDDNKVYLPESIEIGKRYIPIITTFSGLYRYNTGDIVQIEGFTNQSPRISICGRKQNLLNINGEKIDENTIVEAMENIICFYNLHISTYYVGIDNSVLPARYALILDIQKTKDISETNIATSFDLFLQELSSDYMDLRNSFSIGAPICKIVPSNFIATINKGNTKPGIITKSIQQILHFTTNNDSLMTNEKNLIAKTNK